MNTQKVVSHTSTRIPVRELKGTDVLSLFILNGGLIEYSRVISRSMSSTVHHIAKHGFGTGTNELYDRYVADAA